MERSGRSSPLGSQGHWASVVAVAVEVEARERLSSTRTYCAHCRTDPYDPESCLLSEVTSLPGVSTRWGSFSVLFILCLDQVPSDLKNLAKC